MKKKYIVATRPSLLAYTQTKQTVALLEAKNPECEFEIVKFSTTGDRVTDKALTSFGGTGVFVKELEQAILDGLADFAIHSLKDVPSVQPYGFVLAAFPCREDARDILLTREGQLLVDLKEDARIGTGSPRRIVSLKQLKPQAQFAELRGNIDTRVQKLMNGEYDAIVLAAAGMNRIGRSIPEQAFLSHELCLPAIGQGAIALECKSERTELIDLLRTINDRDTELAILAERSFMQTIGGGCKFPLAAHATVNGENIHLTVMIGDHQTGLMLKLQERGKVDNPTELGVSLAHQLMAECERIGLEIPYQ